MDNTSAFDSNIYDNNVRKVIPLYDLIYEQIFDLIKTYFGGKPIALLDTGCGTGSFGYRAREELDISDLMLCDPSKDMMECVRKKMLGKKYSSKCVGSETMDFKNRFDVVTAIQSHHYFDKRTREKAVMNCFDALKDGGIFIYFENTAPLTETGKTILLDRIEKYQLDQGRTEEEVKEHRARYNKEYFPINIKEHLELMERAGFRNAEIFWMSYMQCGFYGIKQGERMTYGDLFKFI